MISLSCATIWRRALNRSARSSEPARGRPAHPWLGPKDANSPGGKAAPKAEITVMVIRRQRAEGSRSHVGHGYNPRGVGFLGCGGRLRLLLARHAFLPSLSRTATLAERLPKNFDASSICKMQPGRKSGKREAGSLIPKAMTTETAGTVAPDRVSHLVVAADLAGQRLDNFLLRLAKGVPKSHVYRIVRSGEVRVNKARASADYRLCRRRRDPGTAAADRATRRCEAKGAADLGADSL